MLSRNMKFILEEGLILKVPFMVPFCTSSSCSFSQPTIHFSYSRACLSYHVLNCADVFIVPEEVSRYQNGCSKQESILRFPLTQWGLLSALSCRQKSERSCCHSWCSKNILCSYPVEISRSSEIFTPFSFAILCRRKRICHHHLTKRRILSNTTCITNHICHKSFLVGHLKVLDRLSIPQNNETCCWIKRKSHTKSCTYWQVGINTTIHSILRQWWAEPEFWPREPV